MSGILGKIISCFAGRGVGPGQVERVGGEAQNVISLGKPPAGEVCRITLRITESSNPHGKGREAWLLDIIDPAGKTLLSAPPTPPPPWLLVDTGEGRLALVGQGPASITLALPAGCRLCFLKHPWSGVLELREEGKVETLDLYSAGRESAIYRPGRQVAGKNGQGSEWSESEIAFLERVRAEKPVAISVIPPDWRGVRSASQNLVSRCLLIGDELDEIEAARVARLISESGCEKLFFGGFPHSYVHLINALRRDAPRVAIYVFWLSSFLQTNEDYAWRSFQLIDGLCREGKIRKWGFAKKGMAETVAGRGVRAEFIMSYVRPVPEGPSQPDPGGPHLGLWALAPIWRKTPYAMLAAAAAVKDAEVSVVGHDQRAREFAYYLGLNMRYRQKPLDFSEMPAALARMHLNLYVTLSECSPMLPMESLAVGAPCLLGPTSHLFEDHSYLYSRLVVPYPDRSDVIAEYMHRALGERDEIINAYKEYAPDYNRRAKRTLTDFLEVAEDSVL